MLLQFPTHLRIESMAPDESCISSPFQRKVACNLTRAPSPGHERMTPSVLTKSYLPTQFVIRRWAKYSKIVRQTPKLRNFEHLTLMILVLLSVAGAYPIGESCTEKNRVYDCGSELLCVNNTCRECTEHSECEENYFCRPSAKDGVMICRHEPLIHPWGWRLIVCMVLIFFVGIMVSGVGIGGGALFVPVMQIVGAFPAEYAISSSNPLIFGGSLAVTIFNFRRKHPDYNRPLINYNVAAIIEPISWLGTIIGVIMNGVFPEWMLYVTQVLLFSYTSVTTFQKGVAEYRKNKKAKMELEDIESKKTDETLKGDTITDVLNPDNPGEEKEKDDEDTENPKSEKKAFSPWVIVVLAVVWVIFVILPFLRGGANSSSIIGIEFCSTLYWIITFVPFPVYIAITGIMIRIAKNYPVIGKDANISVKQIVLLVVFGILAGVAAGFLGIGGGVIKGPLLLLLGIAAEEMAATSSFMILLTSGITSIQFIARGTMPYAEFGIYVAFGFVSFLLGVFVLKVLIQKTGRRDILLHLLGSVIALAAILMTYMGITTIVTAVKNKENMGFKPYCR